MDVEELVKKYAARYRWSATGTTVKAMRAALTELAAGYEQRLKKIQADDLMAQCMEQTRSDLIAAGVIDKGCAPIFLSDAVISRIRNLEQKDYTGGDAELLRERIRQLEAERVPDEPTAEMQAAGAQAIRFETTTINKLWTANKVWRAMLAAAPQPQKESDHE